MMKFCRESEGKELKPWWHILSTMNYVLPHHQKGSQPNLSVSQVIAFKMEEQYWDRVKSVILTLKVSNTLHLET